MKISDPSRGFVMASFGDNALMKFAIVIIVSSVLAIHIARAEDVRDQPPVLGSRSSHHVAHVQTTDSAVDLSVRPGDDFYRFANGPWLDSHTLPPGSPSYGSTAAMAVRTSVRVEHLLRSAASSKQPRTVTAARVGDYYAAQIDMAAIQRAQLAPLASTFKLIGAIEDRTALSAYLGTTLRADIDSSNHATDRLFGLLMQHGISDSTRYLPQLLQGGLGVLDRDFYLESSDRADALRQAYGEYVAALLRASNVPDAEARAPDVVELEIAIARAQVSTAESEDVNKQNNLWQASEFAVKAPGIDWHAYFSAASLTTVPEFIVWQPTAITGISALVGSESLDSWKAYLYFHALDHGAAVLPSSIGQARSAFLARREGVAAPPPSSRGKADSAMAITNAMLGEAVGRLYVERYFHRSSKLAATAMVENIRVAFKRRIAVLEWLSPVTREKALMKLAAMTVEVGYPERWTDYSALKIARDDAWGNLERVELFRYHQRLSLIGLPVDPGEWAMDPQVVGAVILLSPNSLDFSAALLASTYFDPGGDLASNYGSSGAGMAHEISHSFDELGNQYDEQGNLAPWWTPEDTRRYHLAQAPLADQFSTFCPLTDTCVHGHQVVAESVADIAGLEIAHDAYHLALNGKVDRVKHGMTGEKRFFLAFARRWRRVISESGLRQYIANDTHAPPALRSDEVRNVDAWYQAFDISSDSLLYLPPDKRIRVW